jgi:hypothetical protein
MSERVKKVSCDCCVSRAPTVHSWLPRLSLACIAARFRLTSLLCCLFACIYRRSVRSETSAFLTLSSFSQLFLASMYTRATVLRVFFLLFASPSSSCVCVCLCLCVLTCTFLFPAVRQFSYRISICLPNAVRVERRKLRAAFHSK